MATPILATKLYIPAPRAQLVARPRLIAQLNDGLRLGHKLFLVSAPAGFGKTTLVSDWVTACRQPVAWLSLDVGDSDPARFLAYLVAAMQTIAPQIGVSVLAALQSPQPPPTESILTALLNEIATLPDKFILVLDDYHVIDSRPVDGAVAFLLEHLPAQLHLVVMTREDPDLPLARLRARGQLIDLRAADLRFTPSEAAEFLNAVMGLQLSAAEVALLEERTEGWIAGLQLAALSMRGQPDIPGFIRAFAGDHRYIVDYLVEEVLRVQPPPVRRFLLQTAILDRLNGSLCEAVTGQPAAARLEALERGNFFVVPLDDQRQWYRYHHLFADVLHAHLVAEQPDQVATLHRRASEWYEQQGSPAQAIRHALAAEDFARAADLIELAWPALRQSRPQAAVLSWFKALPNAVIQVRPVLSSEYAWALLGLGELEGMESRLRDAERWLDPPADGREQPPAQGAQMVVVDNGEFRRLPGSIALMRAGLALARGDMAETVKNARRVLALAPEDDRLRRGGAASQLGLAAWASGDLETARQMTAEGMATLRLGGYHSAAIGCALVLADIQLAQGRLHEALTTYERALQWATPPGAPVLRGAADACVGLSDLLREQNDLKAATQHLLTSQALGEFAQSPQNPYRWRVAMARIRTAHGDLEGALDLLEQAERLYEGNFSPNVRPVAAWKTRVWVAQGRLGEALGWVNERGLSARDDLSYLREFEHITLARVLLARDRGDRTDRPLDTAIGLLERLRQAAQAGGRMGNVLEILLLQALTCRAQGDLPAALGSLQQALTLAESVGYIRIFVDEGPALAQLLREIAAHGIMPAYTGRLLAAFEAEPRTSGASAAAAPVPIGQHQSSPAAQPLFEPLSPRELEILRLFKEDLSGPEIAQELVIALSTVRTHTKGIYSKLNVNNRRAAVKRAGDLGLI
jgi:LuxR family maltose regulon positive regulatory protein